MSNQNDEIERLKRLRERQIRLRDPTAQGREVQRKVSARYKKEKLTVGGVIRDIPGKWMGTILGAIIGLIMGLGIVLLLQSEAFWIEYVPYFFVLVGAVMGRGVGAAIDWREEDHEELVRRGR